MPVIELRNYLLQDGATGEFIRYFEEHFLFSQRDEGMQVLGQFEVVGEPSRFVWIRGFESMAARLRGLSGFYGGPFWLARRDEANAMIREHHDVHLLRPLAPLARLTGGTSPEDVAAAAPGTVPAETGLVVADFYRVPPAALGRAVELFEREIQPALVDRGHQVLGHFTAELAPNDYPRLPVIQDPGLLVVMTAYRDAEHCRRARHDWGSRGSISERAFRALPTHEVTALHLRPTARSLIRHRSAAGR